MFYYSLIFPQRAVREVQSADNLSQAMNVLAPRSTRSAPEKAQKVQVLWLDKQHEWPPEPPQDENEVEASPVALTSAARAARRSPRAPTMPPAVLPPQPSLGELNTLGQPLQTMRALGIEIADCLLWCCIYFGTGSAFYMNLQGWNIWQSLYFLMVTAATVGYGDLYPDPSVPGSRMFTLFYIFFGIVVVFAKLSALIAKGIKPMYISSRAALERWFPQSGVDIDGDGTEDFKVPRKPLYYYSKNLVAPFICIVAIQCMFAEVFCAIEGWDFGSAMYHCLVTMTTVGFGDVKITSDGGRMWAFFHIVISVSILAASIRDVSELSKARQEALRKMDMVKGSLDVDLMMSLDKDGDGVNQFEFVIGMLTMLDAVKQEDVDMFVKLFEVLDSDASGKLEENDIRAGLEGRKKQLHLMQNDQRPILKMIEAGFKPERARSGSPPYM